MPTRIFVGRLPKVCSNEELWLSFQAAFGAVRHAYVVRFESGCSRGFGFVDFELASSRDKAVGARTLLLKGSHTDVKPTNDSDKMPTHSSDQEPTPAVSASEPSRAIKPLSEVPLKSWGLDPLFGTYVKLFVSDLTLAGQFTGLPASTKICGKSVVLAQLLGIAVTVERKEKFLRFQIDDGSGTIWCVHWFETAGALDWDERILGQTVNVYGRVSMYQGERQLNVQNSHLESDPHAELMHWLQVIHISNECFK